MFFIKRREFSNRILTTEDLQNAAEMWKKWYLIANRLGAMGSRGVMHLSAEIYGVPQSELKTIQSQFPNAQILEADKVHLSGNPTAVDQPIDLTVWTRALEFAANRPLVVLLYAKAEGHNAIEIRGPISINTLLLMGQVNTAGFILKAAQQLGSTDLHTQLFKHAPWAHEKNFLKALDLFRSNSDPKAALNLLGKRSPFQTYDTERKLKKWTRLFYELPNDRSPQGLLLRLVVPTSLAITLFGARHRLESTQQGYMLFCIGILLCVLLIGSVIIKKWKSVAKLHKAMNASLSNSYSRQPNYAKVNISDTGLDNDINVIKYAQDVAASGGVHCYDFQIVSTTPSQATFRVFYLPADKTLLTITFIKGTADTSYFPTQPVPSAKTFYNDGSAIQTMASNGVYRSAINPALDIRFVDNDANLSFLITKHRDRLAKRAQAGSTPIDVDPDSFFTRDAADHTKANELYRSRGSFYTWSDALHEAFDIRRGERSA